MQVVKDLNQKLMEVARELDETKAERVVLEQRQAEAMQWFEWMDSLAGVGLEEMDKMKEVLENIKSRAETRVRGHLNMASALSTGVASSSAGAGGSLWPATAGSSGGIFSTRVNSTFILGGDGGGGGGGYVNLASILGDGDAGGGGGRGYLNSTSILGGGGAGGSYVATTSFHGGGGYVNTTPFLGIGGGGGGGGYVNTTPFHGGGGYVDTAFFHGGGGGGGYVGTTSFHGGGAYVNTIPFYGGGGYVGTSSFHGGGEGGGGYVNTTVFHGEEGDACRHNNLTSVEEVGYVTEASIHGGGGGVGHVNLTTSEGRE